MKKAYHIFVLAGMSIMFLALIPYRSGSPGAKTGSPGDGSDCTSCHSGDAVAASDWITSSVDESGYAPGEIYTITATGTHEGIGLFGFELTAEDASNAKVGVFSLSDATETKLTNSGSSVSHTAAGTAKTDNSKSWSFSWTAPADGTGDVTFYAAFNAANNNSSTSGDVIYTSSLVITEKSTVGVDHKVHKKEDLVIYQGFDPNNLFLSFASKENQEISIRIYDELGRLVISKDRSFVAGKINLDISELKSGVHLVQIINSEGNYTKKVRIIK